MIEQKLSYTAVIYSSKTITKDNEDKLSLRICCGGNGFVVRKNDTGMPAGEACRRSSLLPETIYFSKKAEKSTQGSVENHIPRK